jgi:hypothetical protein
MPLTQAEWDVERVKLVAAQSDIQEVIDAIDAAFDTGPRWDRTGVVGGPTWSNDDLTVTAGGATIIRSTLSRPLGKRYFEIKIDSRGSPGYLAVGLITDTQSLASPPTSLAAVPAGAWVWRTDGWHANNGASAQLGSTWADGDVIGVAFDATGKLWFARNGVWAQGDPAAGTSPVYSNASGNVGACFCSMGASGTQRATLQYATPTYAAPSGFALMTAA